MCRAGGAIVMLVMAVGMAGCLSGCSSGPDLVGYTQNGAVIRYDPADTTEEEALEEAQSHCDDFGLKAVLRSSVDFVVYTRFQGFDCVAPSQIVDKGILTLPAERAAVVAVAIPVPDHPAMPELPVIPESTYVPPDLPADASPENSSPENANPDATPPEMPGDVAPTPSSESVLPEVR